MAASYVFYLFAGVQYLFFILYTTVVTYLTARLMQKRADAEESLVAANRDVWQKAERKALLVQNFLNHLLHNRTNKTNDYIYKM